MKKYIIATLIIMIALCAGCEKGKVIQKIIADENMQLE